MGLKSNSGRLRVKGNAILVVTIMVIGAYTIPRGEKLTMLFICVRRLLKAPITYYFYLLLLIIIAGKGMEPNEFVFSSFRKSRTQDR